VRPRHIATSAFAALLTVALLGCSDERCTEAFCDQLDATIATGPLFPDRTDGEPVPEPDAMAALEELSEVAPDAIRDDVEVLVAEGRALVADADERDAATTTSTDAGPDDDTTTRPTHPARADVEAAQVSVATFSADECGVDTAL
jgi:hypothetical protein